MHVDRVDICVYRTAETMASERASGSRLYLAFYMTTIVIKQ